MKNFEYSKNPSTTFLSKFADLMFDRLEKDIPNDDERDHQIRNLLAVVKLYLTSPNSFIQSLQSGNRVANRVVENLTRSYRSLKIRNPHSLTIQEIIYPSEVICIQSQFKPTAENYAAIKAL